MKSWKQIKVDFKIINKGITTQKIICLERLNSHADKLIDLFLYDPKNEGAVLSMIALSFL